jgi:RNA polymerase sigma-B factor
VRKLSESEVNELFVEWQETGDTAIRNQLVEHHRWLTTYCANRFTQRGEAREDLVQVASVGLVHAVNRFDPGRGVAFSTFAVPTIVGELRRHFRDKTWSVHVPRRGKELYQAVGAVIEDLTAVLGRSPTVNEIAERADVSVDEALEALEVRDCYRTVSFEPAGEDDADGADTMLGIADLGFDAAEARCVVSQLLDTLPTERDRLIVELRFLAGLTQSEIGARVGVSQVQVSRLLQANLERMRAAATRSPARLA